eukprot:6196864-Pleurochrysis_carterae.AAC.2
MLTLFHEYPSDSAKSRYKAPSRVTSISRVRRNIHTDPDRPKTVGVAKTDDQCVLYAAKVAVVATEHAAAFGQLQRVLFPAFVDVHTLFVISKPMTRILRTSHGTAHQEAVYTAAWSQRRNRYCALAQWCKDAKMRGRRHWADHARCRSTPPKPSNT